MIFLLWGDWSTGVIPVVVGMPQNVHPRKSSLTTNGHEAEGFEQKTGFTFAVNAHHNHS
jgi:hypothetical protein